MLNYLEYDCGYFLKLFLRLTHQNNLKHIKKFIFNKTQKKKF